MRFRDKEWQRLVDCWILGDKLSSVSFKDATCDAICDKVRSMSGWPTALHQSIYPASTKMVDIRKLMVDIAVWKWRTGTLENCEMDESWNEFFKDVMVKLHKTSEKERNGIPPFANPHCKYHEHVAAKLACYKSMF